ncbi:hypothetical protein TTHERM_000320339 (macronuclear) [Tetrahymena thermophila SB210]|uniref:Uncharacterized protein n=1 Tax=Tetrahymena thermophila (strain SB210) TaxID=312017 RepID=W7X6Y8_TETTS|nr:hypothetical protein TTHERM_000320339 [Tetrahymena thermophila SB210]EWS75145.1 hypothetical protein TTHERM_000320339 [Tetrahymena thermophila SB210]|eukprot:XP_012652301.1 hypothetical protein TTHERM_000320339 [Tetrahymena thermophila SB210]
MKLSFQSIGFMTSQRLLEYFHKKKNQINKQIGNKQFHFINLLNKIEINSTNFSLTQNYVEKNKKSILFLFTFSLHIQKVFFIDQSSPDKNNETHLQFLNQCKIEIIAQNLIIQRQKINYKIKIKQK